MNCCLPIAMLLVFHVLWVGYVCDYGTFTFEKVDDAACTLQYFIFLPRSTKCVTFRVVHKSSAESRVSAKENLNSQMPTLAVPPVPGTPQQTFRAPLQKLQKPMPQRPASTDALLMTTQPFQKKNISHANSRRKLTRVPGSA